MAYRSYYCLGKRIARTRAVDADGVLYPGVSVYEPNREADAAAQANGFANAAAYRAAIKLMLTAPKRRHHDPLPR